MLYDKERALNEMNQMKHTLSEPPSEFDDTFIDISCIMYIIEIVKND